MWRNQKHDHVNYDQFAPNFNMAYETIQRASAAPSYLAHRKQSYRLRSWRIFYYVIWENGMVGTFVSTNMAATI